MGRILIGHEKPIDRIAARVIMPGINWDPKIKIDIIEIPLDIYEPPKNAKIIVGERFGRLTVIGYLGPKKEKRNQRIKDSDWRGIRNNTKKDFLKNRKKIITSSGAQWLVRCDCGLYEIRRSKKLKKNADIIYMCRYCSYLNSLIKSNLTLAASDPSPVASDPDAKGDGAKGR